MKINRTLYNEPFTVRTIPIWHCPSCKKGMLKGDPEDFIIEESVNSKKNQINPPPDWDPEWIHGSFSCKLTCQNGSCNEKIFVVGRMRISELKKYNDTAGIWEFQQDVQLFPQLFKPTLHLFEIDNDIPENIQNVIENAFMLFWVDESSCANKIRNVVELIMDDKKVGKTFLDKKRNRRHYTLHKRIELFHLSNPDASNLLMAIKWIGNSGSHSNEVLTKDDLIDGFEILQHVTYKLYEKETIRIKKLGKQINKGKGPVRKRNSKGT